jgi:hypothetical protein
MTDQNTELVEGAANSGGSQFCSRVMRLPIAQSHMLALAANMCLSATEVQLSGALRCAQQMKSARLARRRMSPCCARVQQHPRQQGCALIAACRTINFPPCKCTNLNSNYEADDDCSNLSGVLNCAKTQKGFYLLCKLEQCSHPHTRRRYAVLRLCDGRGSVL